MRLPEIVTVNVAALQPGELGHLPVIDGRVREIRRIATDRTVLTYLADGSTGAQPLDPDGVIGCVRRAHWRAS